MMMNRYQKGVTKSFKLNYLGWYGSIEDIWYYKCVINIIAETLMNFKRGVKGIEQRCNITFIWLCPDLSTSLNFF